MLIADDKKDTCFNQNEKLLDNFLRFVFFQFRRDYTLYRAMDTFKIVLQIVTKFLKILFQ